MSIAGEIQRIKRNIANVYNTCEDKGASLSVVRNSANLAACVSSIVSKDPDNKGEFLVRVVDYDGSIIKQDHLDSGSTFTLPSAPTHTGLVLMDGVHL